MGIVLRQLVYNESDLIADKFKAFIVGLPLVASVCQSVYFTWNICLFYALLKLKIREVQAKEFQCLCALKLMIEVRRPLARGHSPYSLKLSADLGSLWYLITILDAAFRSTSPSLSPSLY